MNHNTRVSFMKIELVPLWIFIVCSYENRVFFKSNYRKGDGRKSREIRETSYLAISCTF